MTPGALACGEEAEPARRELARLSKAAVTASRRWFEWAVREGDLPGGTDCAILARYIATVLNGLAVQAASGATEKGLRQVAAVVIRAWPAWPSTRRPTCLRASVGSTEATTDQSASV